MTSSSAGAGKVEPTAVICSDARRGGVHEPLLGHHMPFRPNGFTGNPAPRPLDDFCTSGEQPRARARQGVVTKCVRMLPAPRCSSVTTSGRRQQRESQPATERNLHDITDGQSMSIDIARAGEGQAKQARCERTSSCKGQDGRPPEGEGRSACCPRGGWCGAGAALCEQADEGGGFSAPPATYLDAQHRQSGSVRS